VTNVRLSAGAADATGKGVGGIDVASQYLEERTQEVGIKGAVLWHADKLTSLIDVHEPVRTAFSFWVQPSDILARLLANLSPPNRTETLFRYARAGIRRSRDIKTRDIGHSMGRPVAIDEIFVDLPVSISPPPMPAALPEEITNDDVNLEAHGDDDDSFIEVEPETRSGIVQCILDLSKDKLDYCYRHDRSYNCVLLLGGPGQGKSTVGQFVSQVFRARLLSTIDDRNTPDINDIIKSTLDHAKHLGGSTDGPIRVPFHVELSRYADALSVETEKHDTISILAYLTKEISKTVDDEFRVTEFRSWISAVPTVFILDGLDEVPLGQIRVDVVDAIKGLVDSVHELNSDALIFGTSRPQGYQGELSQRQWAHWSLLSLEPDEALRVADALGPIFISDEDRRVEIIETMRDASSDDSTASLMVNPLQVTILFHLVATHNSIPKDRWTLFNRHYETLRDREIAKGGENAGIVRRYKSQIDRIHYDAGYILHVRAETAGGAGAFLSVNEFEALVRGQLVRDGFESELERAVGEIVRAATDRLVFLRSRVEGQIAFDVRSLQEFMAAARLSSSPENLIHVRLSHIAGLSYWNNVFRIAVNRIFASAALEESRDSILRILESIDAGNRNRDEQTIKAGSAIALQLLDDGIGTNAPMYRRILFRRSFSLITIRGMINQSDIAERFEATLANEIEYLTNDYMAASSIPIARSVLKVLVYGTKHKDKTIRELCVRLMIKYWPVNDEVFEIFEYEGLLPVEEPLLSMIRDAQWASDPDDVEEWRRSIEEPLERPDEEREPAAGLVFEGHWKVRWLQFLAKDDRPTDLEVGFISILGAPGLDPVPKYARPEWGLISCVRSFAEKPSRLTLARIVEVAGENNLFGWGIGFGLPWVAAIAIRRARSASRWGDVVRDIQEGKLGDLEDWIDIETRWVTSGVRPGDLLEDSSDSTPLKLGGLVTRKRLIHEAQNIPSTLNEIHSLYLTAPESVAAKELLLFVVQRSKMKLPVDVVETLLKIQQPSRRINVINYITIMARLASIGVDLAHDKLDSALEYCWSWDDDAPRLPFSKDIIQHYNRSRNRRILGVIRIPSTLPTNVMPEIRSDACTFHSGDDVRIRRSVAMLILATGRLTRGNFDDAIRSLKTDKSYYISNMLLSRRWSKGNSISEYEFKMALAREVQADTSREDVGSAYITMRNLLEAARSNFADPSYSTSLSLPSIYM
jgi:hypothetical protein